MSRKRVELNHRNNRIHQVAHERAFRGVISAEALIYRLNLFTTALYSREHLWISVLFFDLSAFSANERPVNGAYRFCSILKSDNELIATLNAHFYERLIKA